MDRTHTSGSTLMSKVVNGVRRNRSTGVRDMLRTGLDLIDETARARWQLRRCETRPGARVGGRVHVEGDGTVSIGSDLVVHAEYLPVDLLTGPGGHIEIGDDVWINFGVAIAAASRVRIGDRTMVGQHSVISDLDVPEQVLTGTAHPDPVEIGDDVWIAGRVTVMPGVTIGHGAVVTAGSIVDDDVAPGAVVGGAPARVLRAATGTVRPVQTHASGVPADAVPEPHEAQIDAVGTLVSDFTIDELGHELARPAPGELRVESRVAPFGQLTQSLLGAPDPDAADFAVVWTTAEGALPSVGRLLAGEDTDVDHVLADVDHFAGLVTTAADRYRTVIVASFSPPPWSRGRGLLDTRSGGIARTLACANLRLFERLESCDNVFVLDAQRWWRRGGDDTSPRGWFMGKLAVPRPVLAAAAQDIRGALTSAAVAPRKLLVLDLDDTLWGGIVGDDGWEHLRLGGHDSVGEAYVAFQRAVLALQRRGVLLAVVSKNEETVALEAMTKHPEMVLGESDLVGWRINWNDKARNIASLVEDLRLGLQSVVFIDDNPVERDRVRAALPEVLVPEWPEDPHEYVRALDGLACFDASTRTAEDSRRTAMYAEERERDAWRAEVESIEDWLSSLGLRVSIESLGEATLPRAAQLLNKTNQMNLSTRRLTESELRSWADSPDRRCFVAHVSDRFGESGLTGVLSVERSGDHASIVDFVMSCRVLGRKVEETLLHVATCAASSLGATSLTAELIPTSKNEPCRKFFAGSGLEADGVVFRWDGPDPYPLPEPVELAWDAPVDAGRPLVGDPE